MEPEPKPWRCLHPPPKKPTTLARWERGRWRLSQSVRRVSWRDGQWWVVCPECHREHEWHEDAKAERPG